MRISAVDGWDLWKGSWRLFLQNPGHDAKDDEKPETRGADAVEVFKVPATAKLRLSKNFPLKEYNSLKSATKNPAKAMIMGPDRVAQMCDIPNSGPSYETADAFLKDVTKIQNEIHALCKNKKLLRFLTERVYLSSSRFSKILSICY